MRSKIWVYLPAMLFLMATGCQGNSVPQAENGISLKDLFEGDFLIGTALDSGQIYQLDRETDQLIAREFNAITPENVMKTEKVHLEWGRFDFDAADRFVEFGEQHGMQMIGHALIWHNQLSPFVKQINDPDSLRAFMQLHIGTVAGRYADRLHGWDVVNEALNEDGSLRESLFYRLLGEQYIEDAFRLAAEAAPQAALYYNDYNIEQPAKREGCIALIRKLQEAGVRVNGVGIQGHWLVGRVPFEEIEKSIEAYAALGLDVMITELDLEVLPRDFSGADVAQRMATGDPTLNPYVDGLPDSVLAQQAADYEALFRIFLKHRDKIGRVTLWGVNDRQSWLNGWPVPGRTNYPLLFDRGNRPKPAYQQIIDLKK